MLFRAVVKGVRDGSTWSSGVRVVRVRERVLQIAPAVMFKLNTFVLMALSRLFRHLHR